MFDNLFATIGKRRSYRTYSGLLPSPDIMRQLGIQASAPLTAEMINILPPNTPLPQIKLIQTPTGSAPPSTYGFIKGARMYAAMGVSDAGNRVEEVAAGMLFEHFVLNATASDIATCWLGGTFSQSTFQQQYEMAGGTGRVIIVSPIGHATPGMRFGERMMRSIVHASARKPFDTLFQFTTPSGAGASGLDAGIRKALEAIRLAPSSRNSQPWRGTVSITGNHATIEISCAKPTGKFAPVDMGIALCHLLLAAKRLHLNLKCKNADFDRLNFQFSAG